MATTSLQKGDITLPILYPVYKKWNSLFFDESIMECQRKFPGKRKMVRYRKTFEFRTRLPKDLKTGTKVYIYEPVSKNGCGKVVGEFTVGKIINCDYPFGAYPFMYHFCKYMLKDDAYAAKYLEAFNTELHGYKKGYILKYALDEESMDHIKKYGTPPDIVDYLYDKVRTEKLDESENIWKWADEWLRKIGFYDEFGHSDYKFAYEVVNPIRYDTPRDLTSFTKRDGTVLSKAPQSFCYVQ